MNLEEYITAFVDRDFSGEVPFPYATKSIRRGQVLTDFGQIETVIYFLRKGIIEVYVDQGEEMSILDFFFADSFFCSYTSLLTGVASDVKIVALTDCVVEAIRQQDLQAAYQHSLIANQLGRIATERLYLRKVKREKELLTQSAEAQYLAMIADRPEIIKRLSVRKVSQYLGIRPESLSRIRKRVIS